MSSPAAVLLLDPKSSPVAIINQIIVSRCFNLTGEVQFRLFESKMVSGMSGNVGGNSTVAQKGHNTNKKVQHKQKSTMQTKQCNRTKQTKKTYNANKKGTVQTKKHNAYIKPQCKQKSTTQTKNNNTN